MWSVWPFPYGRNLGFLDRSRYFYFQVAPQLYSRGWVNLVPDSLLLRKYGSTGNRTRISGSVARNSDHWTTEAVYFLLHNIHKFSSYVTRSNTSPFCSQELWPLDNRGCFFLRHKMNKRYIVLKIFFLVRGHTFIKILSFLVRGYTLIKILSFLVRGYTLIKILSFLVRGYTLIKILSF
jgi:hypothetical protein